MFFLALMSRQPKRLSNYWVSSCSLRSQVQRTETPWLNHQLCQYFLKTKAVELGRWWGVMTIFTTAPISKKNQYSHSVWEQKNSSDLFIFGIPWGAWVLLPSRPFSAQCSASWCWGVCFEAVGFGGERGGRGGINSHLRNDTGISDTVWIVWPLHCLRRGGEETAERHQCSNCQHRITESRFVLHRRLSVKGFCWLPPGARQLLSAVALVLCQDARDPVPLATFRLSRCDARGYMGSLHFVPERGSASGAEDVSPGNPARAPPGSGQRMRGHGRRGSGQLLR